MLMIECFMALGAVLCNTYVPQKSPCWQLLVEHRRNCSSSCTVRLVTCNLRRFLLRELHTQSKKEQ